LASKPPTSDTFMREVDDALRQDRALGIWQNYGRSIVIGLIVALIALAGYLYWQSRQRAAAGVEGEKLSQALDDLAAEKTLGLKPTLETLTTANSVGNRAAAKLTLAAMALQKGDTKGAAAQFGAIASDTSLAQPYRDLALVRQTATEFDTLKPETVIARLKPLAISGNPWFGSAGEMVGIAYMRMNKPDLAGATFAALARDENVPDTIRSRVVQLAGVMGIDALPAGAGPGTGTGGAPTGKDKN